MAAKKDAAARYRVLRDYDGRTAGEIVELDPDTAALAVRDGMVAPAEEG